MCVDGDDDEIIEYIPLSCLCVDGDDDEIIEYIPLSCMCVLMVMMMKS